MLISSKEIKTISTINIKLQLSHQGTAGFQARQGLGISHWCTSLFNKKNYPVHRPLTSTGVGLAMGILILDNYWSAQTPRVLHVVSRLLPRAWCASCLGAELP